VTVVPAQNVVPGDAVIVTEGLTEGVTFIVMPLLVTTGGIAPVALLVISTVTTSPFANEEEVKVAALVPAGLPFFFH
jgi:hypothetical protein